MRTRWITIDSFHTMTPPWNQSTADELQDRHPPFAGFQPRRHTVAHGASRGNQAATDFPSPGRGRHGTLHAGGESAATIGSNTFSSVPPRTSRFGRRTNGCPLLIVW